MINILTWKEVPKISSSSPYEYYSIPDNATEYLLQNVYNGAIYVSKIVSHSLLETGLSAQFYSAQPNTVTFKRYNNMAIKNNQIVIWKEITDTTIYLWYR